MAFHWNWNWRLRPRRPSVTKVTADALYVVARPERRRSALLESPGKVSRGQITRPGEPERRAWCVLGVEPAAAGLLPEIVGQALPGKYRFQVIGQEDAAGDSGAAGVMHAPAL